MLYRVALSVLLSVAVKGGSIHGIDGGIEAPDHSTFRKDYKYFPAAKGWLKLHKMPSSWIEAQAACALEGAILTSPINEGLASTMKLVLVSTETFSAFTGVHSMNTQDDFFSIEGVHINEMPVTWLFDEPNNLNGKERCVAMEINGDLKDVSCSDFHAFMCYKKKSGQMKVNECGFNARDYVKDKSTGSCYKIHPAATWYDAFSICAAEGGHLAVINSDREAQVIKNVINGQHKEYIYIGMYNLKQYKTKVEVSQWTTVDGKTLEEAGYSRWKEGQPNNTGGEQNCGSVYYTEKDPLLINDVSCNKERRFICEIEL